LKKQPSLLCEQGKLFTFNLLSELVNSTSA